jgi:hypothetical protein
MAYDASPAVPLIRPDHVPVPTSLGRGARVVSVYSPALTRFNGQLVMAFGVSVYCLGDSVAADSIALATTPDEGATWRFNRYLLVPAPSACVPGGAIVQYNDPFIWVEDNRLQMVYTAAQVPYECGNLGRAAFSASWELVEQDDFFYDSRNCEWPGGSRPSVSFVNGVRDRLWFDTANMGIAANVSVPFPSLGRLPSPSPDARIELPVGAGPYLGNLDVVAASADGDVTVQGDGGVGDVAGIFQMARVNGVWVNGRLLTIRSGQAWDSWYHGTPTTFEGTLYFAGFRRVGNLPIGTLARWRTGGRLSLQ